VWDHWPTRASTSPSDTQEGGGKDTKKPNRKVWLGREEGGMGVKHRQKVTTKDEEI